MVRVAWYKPVKDTVRFLDEHGHTTLRVDLMRCDVKITEHTIERDRASYLAQEFTNETGMKHWIVEVDDEKV